MEKYNEDHFVKKLSKEEIENLKRIVGSFALSSFGEDVYRLPGGAVTGIGGVNLFHEAMKKEFEKRYNK